MALLDSPLVSVSVLREVVGGLKDELDEHRVSINDNTDEIQANFAFLCELDRKIDRVAERVDELCIAIAQKPKNEFKIAPLSARERDVFFALYALGEVQPFVSYRQIAKKLGVGDSLVSAYVAAIVEKGVPVVKKYDSGIAYIKLDNQFRQLQAKKALVGLNAPLSCWL